MNLKRVILIVLAFVVLVGALVLILWLPLGREEENASSQPSLSSWQGTTVSVGEAPSSSDGDEGLWETGALQSVDPDIRAALESSNPLDKAYQEHLNAGEDKSQLNETFMGYWRDEIDNAFALALGACDEQQSVLLQNAQDAWVIRNDEQQALYYDLLGRRYPDEAQREAVYNQYRLDCYRDWALTLYEYYCLYQGDVVEITYLFGE